jgi:hypothetical protein
MKTSNKLLIVAAGLIFSFLVLHDFTLQAEFKKGDYMSPLYKMEKIDLKDFDAVKIDPSNRVNLRFEQGSKFEVWVNNSAKNDLSITKIGRELNIVYKKRSAEAWSEKRIYIICPQLKSLITTSSVKRYYLENMDVIINNFKQDSMTLQTSHANTINLFGATISKLTAGSDTSGGKLNIGPFSHIQDSDIDMQGNGELRLYDVIGAGKVHYKLSPQAIVTLSNDALKLMPQQ